MYIKQVNHNTVDVFIGKGWDFWGRFKLKFGENPQAFQIAGTKFPKREHEKLEMELFK